MEYTKDLWKYFRKVRDMVEQAEQKMLAYSDDPNIRLEAIEWICLIWSWTGIPTFPMIYSTRGFWCIAFDTPKRICEISSLDSPWQIESAGDMEEWIKWLTPVHYSLAYNALRNVRLTKEQHKDYLENWRDYQDSLNIPNSPKIRRLSSIQTPQLQIINPSASLQDSTDLCSSFFGEV